MNLLHFVTNAKTVLVSAEFLTKPQTKTVKHKILKTLFLAELKV